MTTTPSASSLPTPSTRRGQRTQRALIAAAREVFERDGFLEARIVDMADIAGVGHGTFYTYFESKSHILKVVLDELQQDLLRPTGDHSDDLDSPYAAIEAANRRYLEGYRAQARMMVVWQEAATHDSVAKGLLYEAKARFVKRTQRAIKQLQADGLADPDLDPRYSAHALTGMVSRFAFAWFGQGESFNLELAVEQLTLLWANALGIPRDSR